ncbi:hypothetical protein GCM10010273_52750 [Streptomyces lavendulocolor]
MAVFTAPTSANLTIWPRTVIGVRAPHGVGGAVRARRSPAPGSAGALSPRHGYGPILADESRHHRPDPAEFRDRHQQGGMAGGVGVRSPDSGRTVAVAATVVCAPPRLHPRTTGL